MSPQPAHTFYSAWGLRLGEPAGMTTVAGGVTRLPPWAQTQGHLHSFSGMKNAKKPYNTWKKLYSLS